MKKIFVLMADFFRFGVFTFGGGWSIIAQMQELYVEKKKVITAEELVDITSAAKSLPGTMIGNVAMLFGYRTAGIPGGIGAVFAMCTPPMLILIAISYGYEAFRSSFWVAAGMEGVQAAVLPIIASAALGLVKGSIKNAFGVLILLVTLAIYLILNCSVVWLVLFGVISGLVYGEILERQEEKKHGAA